MNMKFESLSEKEVDEFLVSIYSRKPQKSSVDWMFWGVLIAPIAAIVLAVAFNS